MLTFLLVKTVTTVKLYKIQKNHHWSIFLDFYQTHATGTYNTIGHGQKGGNRLPTVAVRWHHMFLVMSQ